MKTHDSDSSLGESIRDYASLDNSLVKDRIDLREHELYPILSCAEALRCFMEHHIFAVWDFMSLVKTLQRGLTCVTTPWVPRGDASLRRFINEIVMGEESDEDGEGGFLSHFEMYLSAMKQVGANVGPAQDLVARIAQGEDRDHALLSCGGPRSAIEFSRVTFDIIDTGSFHQVAAAFAVGREGLIPPMFTSILEKIEIDEQVPTSLFRYYLERHIEVDGEHHGPLSRRLLESACGESPEKWHSAKGAARKSLLARSRLWQAILIRCRATIKNSTNGEKNTKARAH